VRRVDKGDLSGTGPTGQRLRTHVVAVRRRAARTGGVRLSATQGGGMGGDAGRLTVRTRAWRRHHGRCWGPSLS
jgi:hypothetical protein